MPQVDVDEPSPDSPFVLDVREILSSFEGDHESYQFDECVEPSTFSEVIIDDHLQLDFHLVKRSYGVEVRFKVIECSIDVPEENIQSHPIYLHDVSREFHLEETIEDTDDVEYIDKENLEIDITTVLEQEMLIASLI